MSDDIAKAIVGVYEAVNKLANVSIEQTFSGEPADPEGQVDDAMQALEVTLVHIHDLYLDIHASSLVTALKRAGRNPAAAVLQEVVNKYAESTP